MRDLTRSDLISELGGSQTTLISCLSFEERSFAVVEALAGNGLREWLCLVNEDIETDISAVRDRATALADREGVTLEFLHASKRDPLRLADTMIAIAARPSVADGCRWVADITTMTHEMVLILVAAADEIISDWANIKLVYNVAKAYSGDDEPTDKWVSRGIHEVRSVIGYPGGWSPGEQTTVVALPGFDPERMRRIVEEIEPDQLIVGIACPVGAHHSWSEDKNRQIAQQLLSTHKGAAFEYPALDPIGAVQALLDATRAIRNNVLLVPLNSKISTAAIGALARQKPEWQVCYAPALVYNLSYATASNCFLACSLTEIRQSVSAALAAAGGA
ncbi:hypothetical protein QH494_03735 [Sphingomonas sp. AR_OL41]|uniref:hypothetical protein n=1 Tax=Sphingomonas sp. AR_OL41 TaxID=3042729 RepID=UPI00247FE1A8|nr:hypothetical protein [Sphingomonas sp. AR_OL41]MDH7971281.1 hypothetical protein [Sphingomonas sp. AR_OL41]